METLLNNKNFIKISVVFVGLLSLFVLVKLVNEVKSGGDYNRGNRPPDVITVTGKGEVTAVSDIATLDLTLSKDGSTTKIAQSDLNDQVTKTLAYLKTKNIADKDIKSEYGGISPKYAPVAPVNCFSYPCPPQPESKIIGYTATQSISVKVRAVDSANDIRTGLADLGITNISGPTFSIDNQDSYMDQARTIAIDNARTKAQKLAKELQVRLGKVTSFSENNYPIMYAAKAMSADTVSSSVPAPELPKGENKITSNVTVTYEIK
ncbi:MAG: SIMPL domain-containing protein [Patescibacteria group bacterium]|nr:SIMPL domain-containing protein [Patescibacteria group bacterium]